MRVRKDELYNFLSDMLGTSSYVGIHGTSIREDIEAGLLDRNEIKRGLVKNLTTHVEKLIKEDKKSP